MENNKHQWILVDQEQKANNLYVTLFYVILVLYDTLYYFLYPTFISKSEVGLPTILGYWVYLAVFLLLPITYFLKKQGKHFNIKYIYFLTYTILTFIDDFFTYFNSPVGYESGNIVEVILLLFSPIFVNKKFFWTVTVGLIMKYLFLGLLLQTTRVLVPIVLTIFISIVVFIILNRFSSYITALTETFRQLQHKEKLALVGQMATSVAHEIRNPLSSLRGFTQLQKEKHPEEEVSYSIMLQEIDRINSILHDLLIIGKPRTAQFDKNDFTKLLTYVSSISQQLANKLNISLVLDIEDELPLVESDNIQMKQVFINLVKNAIESMDDGGTILIKARKTGPNNIVIEICDEGCGIDSNLIPKLGEPFYTTKPDGTGLGLMVTYKIIEEHQGTIHFDSTKGQGTKVYVTLPICQN